MLFRMSSGFALALAVAAGPLAAQPIASPGNSAAPATEPAGQPAGDPLPEMRLPGLGRGRPAAPSAPALPNVRVQATSVIDNRSSLGNGGLTVGLTLFLDASFPGAAVRGVQITRSVDDQDRTVFPKESTAAVPNALITQLTGRGGRGARGGVASLTANALLQNPPSRSSQVLKLLEGTVDVFVPSEEDGSVVRIPRISQAFGRLETPGIAEAGIRIHRVTQEEFDSLKQQNRIPPAATAPFPLAFVFYYNDPDNRLMDVQIQLPGGTVFPLRLLSSGASTLGTFLVCSTGTPIPADAELVVRIVKPESIRSVPFRVENIPLP